MRIVISGLPGSGKSTVAKALAKKMRLKHLSAGDFMRQMAKERGISLLELSAIAEKDKSIDKEIDRRTVEFGQKEDDFVMDSRIAWHFIPDTIKVFLEVNLAEATKRIFNDLRPEEKENTNPQSVKENIREREESEKLRYRTYYNVNYSDQNNYDLIIDTTMLKPEEIVEKIIEFVKKR